jgi:uncharacterized protein YlxP (DUF503 family)
MHVGAISIELRLPGCHSLKDKRRRMKPLLAGLHRHFNVSAAEVAQNDNHQLTTIACAVVSNNSRHVQQILSKVPDWIEKRHPDFQLIDDEIILL